MSEKGLHIAKVILRIGIFGTFFGHGILAMEIQQSWVVYLTTVGFTVEMALFLMPLIGALDIAVAIMALVYPIKAILIWACIWAFAAALIRPLSGTDIWPFVERWSLWAAPLSLLLINGLPKKFTDLFRI